MKNLITLSIVFVFALSANSQMAVKWTKNYGGTSNDMVGDVTNWHDAPNHSIVSTSDGGYAMVGFTNSLDHDVLNNYGDDDVLLIKLDANGNKMWSQTFGGSSTDRATSVIQTSDGGYAITGMTSSNDTDFTGNHGGAQDLFIIRLDALGNILWTHLYGGTQSEWGYSILEISGGGLAVGGFTNSSNGDIVTTVHGNSDYWLLTVDAAGNVLHSTTYGGSNDDWLNSICATPDGGFALCGWTQSGNFDVTNNFGGKDYWIVKTDSTGLLQWENSYGASGDDWATSIIADGSNFTIVGGSTSGIVSGPFGGTDVYTIQIDSVGNIIWQNQFGGSANDEGYEVIKTNSNTYMIIGASISDNGLIVGNFGVFDYFATEIDNAGNTIWSKSMGGSALDWAVSVAQGNNGDILLAGSTVSNDYYVDSNYGGWDLWVVCLTNNYNVVSGQYYRDNNNSGIFDSGDAPHTNAIITDTLSNEFAFTDTAGMYSLLLVDTGDYCVTRSPIRYHVTTPTYHNGNFATINNIDTAKDFVAVPTPGINDLDITMVPSLRFRPGFPATYDINYCNQGTTTLTATIVMVLDTSLIFDSASVAPTSISNDSLFWSGIALNSGDCAAITVYVHVKTSASIGDTIRSTVAIDGGVIDFTTEDNTFEWASIITGSFDPNDKQVNSSLINSNNLSNPDYLNYIIRFQNTGNDTAFTVLITDYLSSNLDFNTFEIIGSSHSVTTSYDDQFRLLSFRFENILLADSNTNEQASHGYVHFRIKPNSSLVLNDQVYNTAQIYFDYNDPIVTNTVVSTVMMPVLVEHLTVSLSKVYPNPASQYIRVILSDDEFKKLDKIKIYDVTGKVVLEKTNIEGGNQLLISVETLVSGLYFVDLYLGDTILTDKFIKN